MVGHHTRLSGLAAYLVASLAGRHLARPSVSGGGSAGACATGASSGCAILKLTIPLSTLKMSLYSFRNPLIASLFFRIVLYRVSTAPRQVSLQAVQLNSAPNI